MNTLKKNFYACFLFLTLGVSVFCQNNTPVTIIENTVQHDSLFSKLDKTKIPTGILYDKFFSFFNVSKFNGIYDTVNNLKSWKNIYNEIRSASVYTPQWSELDSLINFENTPQNKFFASVPIGILNVNYNTIKENALEAGYLLLQNNQLYENPQSTISPYNTSKIFIMTPLKSYIIGTTVTFAIDSTLYFSNTNNVLPTLEIDFGDGLGYREVDLGDIITVNYTAPGFVQLKLKATFQNQTLKASSVFQVASAAIGPVLEHIIYQTVPAQYYLEGPTNIQTAKATVYFGCGNPGPNFKKPFIFVEGFDPGHNFATRINYGDFDWAQFSSGGILDKNGDGKPDMPEIQLAPTLINKLHNEGWDIVFLDQKHGTNYIQRNAMTVARLIVWVNQNKTTNNKLVVAGASMGGLVTRFALKYMENNNIDHQTKLWITFDSPHEGANIPLGVQEFINFFASSPNPDLGAIEARNILNTPAAKQLLVYHFTSLVPSEHPFRTDLLNDNNFNYPQNLKKMAIANGSILGENGNQGFNANTMLFDLKKKFDVVVDNDETATAIGKIWAVPDDNLKKIFMGRKRFLGINIAQNDISVGGTRPYDNCPGGIVNTVKGVGENGGKVLFPNHSFIPTVSALAIKPSFINNNLFWDIQSNIMLNANNNAVPHPNIAYITNHNITPFDIIMGPGTSSGFTNINGNQQHVEITNENINWLMNEVSPDDLYLQNKTITANAGFEARNTITTGYNVDPVPNRQQQGAFQTNAGSLVDIRAGQEITIKEGTIFKTGSNVHLFIEAFPCPAVLRMANPNNNQPYANNSVSTHQVSALNLPSSNKNNSADYFAVIPNPTNGTFKLQTSNNLEYPKQIIIRDVLGRNVKIIDNPNAYEHEFNLEKESAGIYMINVYYTDKVISKRIIKN